MAMYRYDLDPQSDSNLIHITVHVHMYVRTYVCTYVCMYVCICMHVHVHIIMHVHSPTLAIQLTSGLYVCVCMYVYACIRTSLPPEAPDACAHRNLVYSNSCTLFSVMMASLLWMSRTHRVSLPYCHASRPCLQ